VGIGVSIVLTALGLILALAVDVELAGLDIQYVGWILAVVGLLGLIMTVLVWGPRGRESAEGTTEVVEERRVRDDRV
jgi:hypothetical protein